MTAVERVSCMSLTAMNLRLGIALLSCLIGAQAVVARAEGPNAQPGVPQGPNKQVGPPYIWYLGAHAGWSNTTRGAGSGLGYGADAGVLQRYDWDGGWAYAGLGAYYLGANPKQGSFNAYGAQLLLRYRDGMLAMLLGPATLGGISGVDGNMHFGWGARLTLDYPILGDRLTVGPGATVLTFKPGERDVVNYAALVSLKAWW